MRKFIFILIAITFSRCHMDDKIHRESVTIGQSNENKLLIAKIKSYKLETANVQELKITHLSGWMEYTPRYLGEKLESIDKTQANLILNIKFSSMDIRSFNDSYGITYNNHYAGSTYGRLKIILDKKQVSKTIDLEVRKFNNKNNFNEYKVIGHLILNFEPIKKVL